ncbi:hypothetical protein C0J45_22818 [Silurus meridionalis]|nr:hypothetical protein C0J45_22818 [Silurus meridionalis]
MAAWTVAGSRYPGVEAPEVPALLADRNIGGGFKLFYYGVDGKRNGVGVILKEEYSKSVVEVKRVSDRVKIVKLEVEGMMINQFESKHGTEEQNKSLRKFTLDLCLQAALHQPQHFWETVQKVIAYDYKKASDFLLDLCSHVKQYESKTGSSVLPALLPVYQSVLFWTINLSERKVSLLLEVLKLQTEKKPVDLRDFTEEESEIKNGYGQRFNIIHIHNNTLDRINKVSDVGNDRLKHTVLSSVAEPQASSELEIGLQTLILHESALHQPQNIRETVEKVIAYSHKEQSDFLLDLCSHVKQYESETGSSVFPVLLPVYQSVSVWSINLSERKVSIFLEVLKLQTQKKLVELRDCTGEESEVRSFLQCLPYISQLRFNEFESKYGNKGQEKRFRKFKMDLYLQASSHQPQNTQQTVEKVMTLFKENEIEIDDDYKDYYYKEQSDFLLDLYSHVKQYESETGSSVLPALLPVYQSGPDVWSINMKERKVSVFLEVLKLQTQKKPVDLRDCTDEESKVRSFLQCLPYISQLRFGFYSDSASIQFLLNLSIAAVDCQSDKGENFTELLASVCSYNTFPFGGDSDGFQEEQSDFLLDLYSHVKQFESKTGSSVLPALLPVYQSVPDVWSIKLSEKNISLLLEVLKLHTQKKTVELRNYTDDETKVRSFLQCLPYISQLRFNSDSASICFLLNLSIAAVDCRSDKGENFTELLASVCSYNTFPFGVEFHGFQEEQSDFLLDLYSHVEQYESKTGRSVLPALLPVYQSGPDVWSINLSKRNISLLLEVLKLQTQKKPVVLRHYKIEESEVRSFLQCLPYISHLRLSKETLQKFTDLLCEVRDGELTRFFLEKTGGDLTSCSLSWEKLIHFLQQRVCRINVNIRKSKIEYNDVRQILPLLSEVQFKRLNPLVLLSVIREIYETRSADCVSGLLSSTHSCINLSNTELDSYHSTALHFTLQHSTSVCLNLLWTSIQEEDLMKILPLFNKVSQLSVDRILLLKMLHCCSKSDLQKGAARAVFSALKNRLDFSCSIGLDLTTETQDNVLPLSTEDCRDISTAIQNSHQLTELILKDCQIEDAALDLFFPVLHTVRLRCSKHLLLQFLALLRVVNESECVRHVRSLSQALDGEIDLSETPLDLQACRSLTLFLEFTEGLSELDLSHCKLSEHGLELLFPHLHKTTVLDLSHNAIDDYLAGRIYTIVSTSSNIQTVRLFNNRITDKEHFQKDKRFEIW